MSHNLVHVYSYHNLVHVLHLPEDEYHDIMSNLEDMLQFREVCS